MSIKMIKEGLIEKDFKKIADGYNNITGEKIEVDNSEDKEVDILDALEIIRNYITWNEYHKNKEEINNALGNREEVNLKDNIEDKKVCDTVSLEEIKSDIIEESESFEKFDKGEIDGKKIDLLAKEVEHEDNKFGKKVKFITTEDDEEDRKFNEKYAVKKHKRASNFRKCTCGETIYNDLTGDLCAKCHNKEILKKSKGER